MNRRMLILISVLPILLGYLINYLIMRFAWGGLLGILIPLGFYLLWTLVGYFSAHQHQRFIVNLLYAHGMAFFCLLLIIIQHSILQQVPLNLWGVLPQMYYLPMISLAAMLAKPLLFFIEIFRFEFFVIPAFLMMIGSFTIGYRMKLRQGRGTNA